MKSKRTDTTENMTADAALQKLHEYGERFMAMFDDKETLKSSKASSSGQRRSQSTPHIKATGAKETRVGPGPNANGASAAKGALKKRQQDSTPTVTASDKKRHQQQSHQERQQPLSGGGGRSAGSPNGAVKPAGFSADPSTGPKKRSRTSIDEIDAIMRAGKKAKQAEAKSSSETGPAASGKRGKAGQTAAAGAAAAAAAAQAEALRRERKLFMSHKASKVHEAVQARPPPMAAAVTAEEDAGLSPEEFQKLQLEVEKFAAGSLDKKSAKQYKARMLARLGAKADTAPRTAASIGKGMAKVAAKRQARALEEAIETGMVQRKGLGKKKRALQAKNRDRGLMEAGPSFKNGILRVKPMKKTRAESGKLRLPKGVL